MFCRTLQGDASNNFGRVSFYKREAQPLLLLYLKPSIGWDHLDSLNRGINFMLWSSFILAGFRGDAGKEKVPGLRGVPFFGVDFYCIFGRFGKMTHLVNFKKCRGSSPGCPGWCGAPAQETVFYQPKLQVFDLSKCILMRRRLCLIVFK